MTKNAKETPKYYPFTCRNCGKKGEANSPRDFCSTRCNKTYLQRKYRDKNRTICFHNANVICAGGNCDTCGWNPKVEALRKRSLSG